MKQLTLRPEDVPPALTEWLQQANQPTLLIAVEIDSDGYVSFQAMPEVDPQLVPRVLKAMAQYEETLRRLL